MLGPCRCLACAAALSGCLDTTHGDLTRGEHAELVCFHLAECATHPMSLAGGLDAPLDIADPVACVRAVRTGFHWLDDDGHERVLGDEPADGFGSDRCVDALAGLPCPMVDADTYIPALERILGACSAGGLR